MSTNHRVSLKLSGEALGGGPIGLDPKVIRDIAEQVATAVHEDVQVTIIVGDGNSLRDAQLVCEGFECLRADYMGVLSTVMDAFTPQDFISRSSIPVRMQATIVAIQAAEPYLPLQVIRHLGKERVVIFGVGAGLLYFLMNTVSAQHALEIHCDKPLVAKNGADSVYDDGPDGDPGTHYFGTLTYSEALCCDLKVIDGSALTLCRDNGLMTCILGMGGGDIVTHTLMDDEIGILVAA